MASFEVFREFYFEAAHALYDPDAKDGGIYRNLHGHSFRVRVTLRGERLPEEQWVIDLGKLGRRLEELRGKLDHSFLNDLEGLGKPTLENLSLFIWGELAPSLPCLAEIGVFRDSLREGCVYRGD